MVNEEKERVVHLITAGEKKVNVIKTIRAFTGFGLQESKDIADNCPIDIKITCTERAYQDFITDLGLSGAITLGD